VALEREARIVMNRTPMKRAPMRRTGFNVGPEWKRFERTERTLTPIRAIAPSAPIFHPEAKREYVRSKALLEACRALPCQCCGRQDGTVCAAHSNWAIHGKGRSIKADDNRVASMCFACHGDLDQGMHMSERGKRLTWWAAHAMTVAMLVSDGLWPPGVPIPDVSSVPAEWV
jgi:hypothetical protein